MSTTSPDWLACHRPQLQPDSCVAACTALLLRARGRSAEEADLIEAWGETYGGGYSLKRAAERLGGEADYRPDLHALSFIKAALQAHQGVLIEVCGGPISLLARQNKLRPALGRARLVEGTKKELLNTGRPHHAVVLTRLEPPDTLWLLDPWYEAQGQPFSTTTDFLLQHMLVGYVRYTLSP